MQTIMYKTNRTIPSREQLPAGCRVEKQAYKWQPLKSSPWAVGVPGAVRGNVDYGRGEGGFRGLPLAGATDGYAFLRTGCKQQAFLVACSEQEHCKSSKWTFSSSFTIKSLHGFLFSPIPVTCPAHLLFLDLITRQINEILR
jgi:hypothetical protein